MDFAQQQRNPGRHLAGFSVVVALHLLLGWAVVSGLAQRVVDVIRNPIETKIIEEQKPPPPPPPENLPPPPKTVAPPPVFVPPPEIQVNPPPAPAPTITPTTTVAPPPQPVTIAPPAPAAPPAPPAPRPSVPPRLTSADASKCAPKGEDYPAAAQRAEATGTTRLRFTIGADGRLQNTEVVRSAGPTREHKMLDRLASQKFAECKFTVGNDADGRPVGGVIEVEYVWKLD
jgi:protein TonB